jgi:hypothetical protein
MLAALAPVVAFTPLAAQSNSNLPVVAVLGIENGAFGPAAKDYDGIGKAVMDLVITDLASTGRVRAVERSRIQAILDEQNLTKSGAVDPTTAIRVGRLFGACYTVTGAFVRNDKNGQNQLVLRTYHNETSETTNGVKVELNGDDMLQLIAKATAEFLKGMKVTACPGTAGATRSGDASPAAQQQGATPAPATVSKPAMAHVEYAKPLSEPEKKKLESVKLDSRTMLIYSRALDAKDRKDVARARQLAQQVKDKYPNFVPADQLIESLKSGN